MLFVTGEYLKRAAPLRISFLTDHMIEPVYRAMTSSSPNIDYRAKALLTHAFAHIPRINAFGRPSFTRGQERVRAAADISSPIVSPDFCEE